MTKKLLIALSLAALGRAPMLEIAPAPSPIALAGYPVPHRRNGVAQARRAAQKRKAKK